TYLDGVEEPVVETKDGWTIDGTELKVRLDAGVNPLDFRGLYKNAGP
ncbi:MAG: ATP-dependent Clp protease proteolytic subunit ClpP, partial [Devosia sp.]|nr:ATP-dependent Clp protease proteolytic subunit ClpP [Devosia sp.]